MPRISGSLISSSSETKHYAAMAGIGLILTSPFLVADLLASGALVPLLPEYRRSSWRSMRSILIAGT